MRYSEVIAPLVRNIADELAQSLGEAATAGDAAAICGYGECLSAAERVWEHCMSGDEGDLDGPVDSSVAGTCEDVDAMAVAELVQRVYVQLRKSYDRAKFGGEEFRREAYGRVIDEVVGISTRWWRVANARRPPVVMSPEVSNWVTEVVDEAFRRGTGLASPRERWFGDDEEHARRMALVKEAAVEVAAFAKYDQAILQAAWQQVLVQGSPKERSGPVATVKTILSTATCVKAPGSNDAATVAFVAQCFASLIVAAKARQDGAAIDRYTEEVRVGLLDFTRSELEAGMNAVPIGGVISANPAASAALALGFLRDAVRTIDGAE